MEAKRLTRRGKLFLPTGVRAGILVRLTERKNFLLTVWKVYSHSEDLEVADL